MKTTNRSGHYYTNQLWFSVAYQELSISSRNLLQILISELRYTIRKGYRKYRQTKEWTNNGEVSCTEAEFKVVTGACSSTYIKSRNQLIKVGFIKQTHRGGTHRGDRAKYRVLICADGKGTDERWCQYPDKSWEDEIPKAKKQLVGTKTQWKKGECGRNL
jgi:hypothetical protein